MAALCAIFADSNLHVQKLLRKIHPSIFCASCCSYHDHYTCIATNLLSERLIENILWFDIDCIDWGCRRREVVVAITIPEAPAIVKKGNGLHRVLQGTVKAARHQQLAHQQLPASKRKTSMPVAHVLQEVCATKNREDEASRLTLTTLNWI
jgi:hypothetical protein